MPDYFLKTKKKEEIRQKSEERHEEGENNEL
jgi:hypothetical protein